MIERGPARECDMVAAFLQAEISSSRYSKLIQPNLEYNGLSRDLIDAPDLENESHNYIRRMLLRAYRGYGANRLLFTGFPSDVSWRFAEIEPQDHGMLFCANDKSEKSWVEVSEGTRSVERIAGRIARLAGIGSAPERETADRIRCIQKDLNSGKVMPPLIAVEGENGSLILVEGHSRATAYVDLKWQHRISIVLGRSMTMKFWKYY
jgi:hypothetical protein